LVHHGVPMAHSFFMVEDTPFMVEDSPLTELIGRAQHGDAQALKSVFE
jgi:hypothetical protein